MKKHFLSFLMVLTVAIFALGGCAKDGGTNTGFDNTVSKNLGGDSSNNQGNLHEDSEGTGENGAINDEGGSTGNLDVSYEDEGSTEFLPPKFADLAINNKFMDGIFTRDKIDYSIVSNRIENCTDYSSLKEVLFQYGSEEHAVFKLSSDDQVENVIKQANEYKHSEIRAVIEVYGDVTVDGTKIANKDVYRVNYATSTSGTDYIVKSGSTLRYTAAGVSLSDGYNSNTLPVFVVEDNAKLIIENKTYLGADETIFFIAKGGTLEVKDSTFETLGLINLGTAVFSSTEPDNYEKRCHGGAKDIFINGKDASLVLNEAAFDAECDDSSYRLGFYYTDYFDSDYGKYLEEAFDYAFSYNPHCYNFGTIDINCSGEQGFTFYASVYDDKVLHYIPGVNIGTINVNGTGRNQLSVDCHVQNYGTINLNGSLNIDRWGRYENIAEGTNAYFENYGVINGGKGTGNGMEVYNYFLNYAGAKIIESRNSEYYTVSAKGMVFDNVVAVNGPTKVDSSLLAKFDDSKWKGTYYWPSDNGLEDYASFYSYNHEMSVDFTVYFGENYVYFYQSANLFNVFDGEKLVIERTSQEYGGRSVLTIIPSSDFSSMDYEIVNETYGTKKGTVKRK